jgi:cation transport protein ChaC
VGGRGPNDEYLINTAEHLHQIGVPDAELSWLQSRVAEIKAEIKPS